MFFLLCCVDFEIVNSLRRSISGIIITFFDDLSSHKNYLSFFLAESMKNLRKKFTFA